jgi:glutamate dehydrogenase
MRGPQEKKTQAIEKICEIARERLDDSDATQVVSLIEQGYSPLSPEDILSADPEDLYGAALALWNHGRHLGPNECRVRVYNPVYEEHGWQSTHTVIEVVSDDMPFMVDSVNMELVRRGLTVHLVVHPVLNVQRSGQGELQEILGPGRHGKNPVKEAWMRFEVDRVARAAILVEIHDDVQRILEDVRLAVEDWPRMRERLAEIMESIRAQKLSLPKQEVAEALEFLQWVANNHFTLIGFRAYDLVSEGGENALRVVQGSGLGILREEPEETRDYKSQSFAQMTAEMRARAREPKLLILTKSTARSTVHRPAHLDYIGIQRFNDQGEVSGEWRFLGLYTSTVYRADPREVPLLRRKLANVIARSGLSASSHAGKTLQNIFDTYPRDEMLQASEDELYDIGLGILQVQERHKLKLFTRRDAYGRFVTALVYVPRDRYNTALRLKMETILMEALNGLSAEFNVQFSEMVLARVHFIVRTQPDALPDFDEAELENRMVEAMISWDDELHLAMLDHFGEEQGNELIERYAGTFPAAYRDDYPVRTALLDVQRLEAVSDVEPLGMHLYRPLEGPEGLLRFKVYGRNELMALSDVLPMLERMGLRVLGARPYEFEAGDRGSLWIIDFDMTCALTQTVDVLEVKAIFQEAFSQVVSGQVESDGFNKLTLAARIPSREVVTLRAICKYLLQTRVPFSQAYMEQTLVSNAEIARLLVQLFDVRFNPALESSAEAQGKEIEEQILTALDAVANLDEDRILRRFLAVIRAILRTNYYRYSTLEGRPYLSFKLDPKRVPELPEPRPMFEIYVYSPWTEGVHLRGGMVARGGLRWSDRMEDYRTEILGLMKAQMVKNAVIVPVGSKGGFVAKRLPGGDNREALMEEVVRCYRTFISGLLDVTDNLVKGEVVPPPDVVRYDGNDPYLVVAADKGTATFSDIANARASDYGFWLGDAFASGGSVGYDHKAMGITARGGWESVKRHFRELGIDTQATPFSVVGVGDMSGDVFGNGMLLSDKIRLIAAFNHLHIFIDPDPDPAISFKERKRLFEKPRSQWTDYDAKKLSPGAAIYPRSAKSIQPSPEARAALGIEAEQLTPNELMQAILKAPVDLLWNGGIGTYVKATSETNLDVGDRANDALRVNGANLRCRVVGEGGNLGLTQLGRIEFARVRNGLVNTDAIDNSGGVDCSDHEVNIKILLELVVRDGDMTLKQRNKLLVEMTDEVAHLVLQHNYLQTQALSVAAARGVYLLGEQLRLIRSLEASGRLDRALEFLPTDEEIGEREAAGQGLTHPELSVLLAYAKIRLYDTLLASDIAEDPYLSKELQAYFPAPLRKSLSARMEQHPLRREIICTHITNSLVNRMGSTFCMRVQEATGCSYGDIARAYAVVREVFRAREMWKEIESMDNKVPAAIQAEMLGETVRLLDRGALWMLRNLRSPIEIAATVEQFAPVADIVTARIAKLVKGDTREALRRRTRHFTSSGVPKELAERISLVEGLYSSLDIADVALGSGLNVGDACETYFALSNELDLPWLNQSIRTLPQNTHWQTRARAALRDELFAELRSLTAQLIRETGSLKSTDARIKAWLAARTEERQRCGEVFADLRAADKQDLAMLSVAVREIRALGRVRIPEPA